jgi:hypothetical protein
MSRRLSLAFLSAMFVYGLSIAYAPSALAAGCDFNACMARCQKNYPQAGAGQVCNSNCGIAIAERRKKGLCK